MMNSNLFKNKNKNHQIGVFKGPDPQAPAWRHAQIWALKIAQIMIMGAFWFRLGLLCIRIHCFFEIG